MLGSASRWDENHPNYTLSDTGSFKNTAPGLTLHLIYLRENMEGIMRFRKSCSEQEVSQLFDIHLLFIRHYLSLFDDVAYRLQAA